MSKNKEQLISEISDLLAVLGAEYVSRRAGKSQLLDERDDAQDNADKTLGVCLVGYNLHSDKTAKLMFRFGEAISEQLELGQYNYDPHFDLLVHAADGAKISDLVKPGGSIKSHIQLATISQGSYIKLMDKSESELEVILGNLKSEALLRVVYAEFD